MNESGKCFSAKYKMSSLPFVFAFHIENIKTSAKHEFVGFCENGFLWGVITFLRFLSLLEKGIY